MNARLMKIRSAGSIVFLCFFFSKIVCAQAVHDWSIIFQLKYDTIYQGEPIFYHYTIIGNERTKAGENKREGSGVLMNKLPLIQYLRRDGQWLPLLNSSLEKEKRYLNISLSEPKRRMLREIYVEHDSVKREGAYLYTGIEALLNGEQGDSYPFDTPGEYQIRFAIPHNADTIVSNIQTLVVVSPPRSEFGAYQLIRGVDNPKFLYESSVMGTVWPGIGKRGASLIKHIYFRLYQAEFPWSNFYEDQEKIIESIIEKFPSSRLSYWARITYCDAKLNKLIEQINTPRPSSQDTFIRSRQEALNELVKIESYTKEIMTNSDLYPTIDVVLNLSKIIFLKYHLGIYRVLEEDQAVDEKKFGEFIRASRRKILRTGQK